MKALVATTKCLLLADLAAGSIKKHLPITELDGRVGIRSRGAFFRNYQVFDGNTAVI